MISYPKISASEALSADVLASKGFDLEPERSGAEKGQVILLFAFFLTAMLGVLGLAMDVGYSASQRRSMQNAADLAAQAGALAVASFNDAHQLSAMTAVEANLTGNETAEGAGVLEQCDYLDNSDTPIFSCDQYVPSTAIGVSVQVRETHDTFFMRIIPGGARRLQHEPLPLPEWNCFIWPARTPRLLCVDTTPSGQMDRSKTSCLPMRRSIPTQLGSRSG